MREEKEGETWVNFNTKDVLGNLQHRKRVLEMLWRGWIHSAAYNGLDDSKIEFLFGAVYEIEHHRSLILFQGPFQKLLT